jgi:hypothetical protein
MQRSSAIDNRLYREAITMIANQAIYVANVIEL